MNIAELIARVMDSNIYLGAGIIFFSRVIDVTLGTFRVQMIVKRKKLILILRAQNECKAIVAVQLHIPSQFASHVSLQDYMPQL